VTQSRGDGNTKLGGTDGLIRPGSLVSHVRALEGHGSHRNGSRSRSVGDVSDGFFESSLRPNWDALENRHGDDWENVRGVGTQALPADEANVRLI